MQSLQYLLGPMGEFLQGVGVLIASVLIPFAIMAKSRVVVPKSNDAG